MPDPITPDELKHLFPGASASTLRANQIKPNPHGLPPAEPQHAQRSPLELGKPGKKAGLQSLACRYRITVTVYACQPLDWDNIDVKRLQDTLRAVGLIPDDNWRILEGHVISQKAHTEAEERTEIELVRLA